MFCFPPGRRHSYYRSRHEKICDAPSSTIMNLSQHGEHHLRISPPTAAASMNDSLAFGTAPTFECAAFAHVRGYLTTLTPLDLDANINFETTTIVLNISSNCSLLCSDASTELTTKWCTCSPHVLHDALAPFVQAAHSSAVSAALSVAMTGAYAYSMEDRASKS